MFAINVSPDFLASCPDFRGVLLYANVVNSDYNPDLWDTIEQYTEEYKNTHSLENIKANPNIQATRVAYKKLGKDPNRYRPSAEALCRRILRGLPLYKINTLVDIINLVSIQTGYSIGGFDADKISGNTISLHIGSSYDHFEGIGRGILNIEKLPVYKDDAGGIGTPTSDNERTKLGVETSRLLTIINGYNGEAGLQEAADLMSNLLIRFSQASDIETEYF